MSFSPFAYFAVGCLRTRSRNRFSRTAQAVEVEFNGVVHFAFDAVSRLARGDAAGEIGRIGGIASRSFFNDDQVPTHFNPACLMIIFCVPGARSSLGFPAIVTTPFFLIMPILPVATARSIQIPTILLDELDHRANFHRSECCRFLSVRQTSDR